MFVCGAAVMVIELAGSRFLAPHFGTSLYVWSSIIGVIMGSLSLGYWLGGRMSVLNPRREIFSFIIFIAALAIIGLALAKDSVLSLADWLAAVTDIRLGSFAAAVALFALPNALLGMVSPYAARLKIDRVDKSGRAVGDLYAISTIGSIAGTFTAGFWLIGMFPAEQINICLAVLLAAVSLFVDRKNLGLLKFLMLAGTVIYIFILVYTAEKDLPLTFDTSYARYEVKDIQLDSRLAMRALANDNLGVQSLAYIYDGKLSDELAVPYNYYFLLGGHFKQQIKNGLLIGGGTFVFTKGFLAAYPGASIDAVEIDPALTGIAKKYFNLRDDPRLMIVNEDGRVFLNQNKKIYDCVYMDAFNSMAMPFQLATKEAAQKIYASLSDGGVVMVNVVSAAEGDRARVLRSLLATYESVFPQVYVFATDPAAAPENVSNYVLAALKSTQVPQWSDADPQLDAYLKTRVDQNVEGGMPVLTDDYAPLEKYALDTIN